MAAPKPAPKPSRPLLFRVTRVVAIALLVIFTSFFAISLAVGSLGAALVSLPAVVLGFVGVWLLFAWRNKWAVRWHVYASAGSLLVFVFAGWLAFHILWKYIQPTVLPKHAVVLGNPWVVEGNVFSNNEFNNAVAVQLPDGRYAIYFHDHDQMEMATSSDGKHFDPATNLFSGQMPTVVKLPDGRYRMYYFVNAGVPPQGLPVSRPESEPQPQPKPVTDCGDNCQATPHNLVSAVSNDGITWTQEAGVRLAPESVGYDASTMIHPTVIRLGDGSWKLYYDGEVDDAHSYALSQHHRKILSASSPDGLTWTRDPGYRIDEKPLHTFEAYSPKAIFENGHVTLRFTTPNGIYQATSMDTLHFTISKNPVFTPGRIPMPTDEGALGSYQDSFVMAVPGGHRMYFWIDGKGTWSAFQKS